MQLLLLLPLSSLEILEKSPKISLTLQQTLQKWGISTTTHFYFRYTENWKWPPFLKTVEGAMNPQQNLGPNYVQLEFWKSEWVSERARDDGGGDKSQSWEYSQLPLVQCRMHTCNNVYVYSCTLQTHLEFLFYFILFKNFKLIN
jgi:hypothetical protein